LAFVTVLIDDLCVWHAVGIGVAVVVLAWVNWGTDFTRSVETCHAFAVMVAIPSDDSGFTDGIFVAATVVGQTRIFGVTFWTAVTRFTLTSVSNATLTRDAVSVGVTSVTNDAPINRITSVVTVTSVVFAANAVVTLWLIDAFGIDVTSVITSLAFINRTDEGIIITGKPEGPLSSVGWCALSVNVIGQSFNTVEKIFSRFNIEKVDQVAWNCTGCWVTFGTISLGRWSGVVSIGRLEFFVENFSM
jgi:hypothetical protein